MKKFLGGLLIFIALIVFGLSYIGVMPFLSGFIAKQVDLGETADTSLITAIKAKYGPVASDTGKVDLNVNLSSKEVTSIFAVWEQKDKYFPLHNVQVRFNADGTGEASGFLRIATAILLAKNLGYSDNDIETGKKYVQYISGDLPFYVKGTGGMTNNSLTLDPSTFQIGRVTVPQSITKPVSQAVGDLSLIHI